MQNFEIVDCTLRDGGYYTNWDFSSDLIETYFAAIRSLPVKYVEVGYRSPEKPGYLGQYFHLNLDTLTHLKGLLRADQGLTIMFNFKDMTSDLIDTLPDALPGTVDLVRFACPPEGLSECIGFARQSKARGLKVAINVMYMTKYVDRADQVLAPLASAENVVDYVALVDSYGGVMPDQAARTMAQAVSILPQPVGYHGHDNLSLAFANSLAALEAGATMLDATFTGMGRGAGNLKTELIAIHREQKFPSGTHYGPLSKAIDMFEAMQKEYGWGTNLAYMVTGAASMPQANVMDWLGTRRYQMDAIVEALLLENDAGFDETAYPALTETAEAGSMKGKPVLVIGGGSSITQHASALTELARSKGMVLVHSSMRNVAEFRDCGLPQIFCLAGQEFQRLSKGQASLLEQDGCVALTMAPPRFRDSTPATGTVCQLALSDSMDAQKLGPVTDEPPLDMALSAASALGATEICLAGFDGYMNASVSEQGNARDVQDAIKSGQHDDTPWKGEISSVTPTLYSVPMQSLYAKIQKRKI